MPAKHRYLHTAVLCLCLWAAPTFAQPPAAKALRSGEQVYGDICSACHANGTAGAPRLGDRDAWAERIAEGQDSLTAEAWLGVRAMPPKGGDPQLRLEEFARAVVWMTSRAGAPWSDPDAAMMLRIRRQAEIRIGEAIRELRQARRDLHRTK